MRIQETIVPIMVGIITSYAIIYVSVALTQKRSDSFTVFVAVAIVGGIVMACTTLIIQTINRYLHTNENGNKDSHIIDKNEE